MENFKMSGKLLSWVWFGIAIIALVLFMYYQSQRNKASTSTADETASSTDEIAASREDAEGTPTSNLTGSVTESTSVGGSVNKGPVAERNIGYISSIYKTTDGRGWIGIDFVSYYTGRDAVVAAKLNNAPVDSSGNYVINGRSEVATIKMSANATIMLKGGSVTFTDLMTKFDDFSGPLRTALFKFTFSKSTSEVLAIEQI